MSILYLGNPSKVCKFFNIVMKGLSYCGEWGAKPCFGMLRHGLQRCFHINEKHVIPILWQPGAATWEKATTTTKSRTSSLWLLQSKLFTEPAVRLPWQGYRLLPQDWQMLGKPFAWFDESIGEKMVCNLGKRWKRKSQKRVKCQKGAGRTLHLYEMGVISLLEVITLHPWWKCIITENS